MKQFAAASLLVFGFGPLLRGQVLYGLKAGPQLTQRKIYDNSGSNISQVPLLTLDIAFTAFLPLSGSFYFHPNLGYSAKGLRAKNLNFTDPQGNNIGTGTLNESFNYVVFSIPINYVTSISSTTDLYFGIGPYIGYALSGKDKVNSASSQTSSNRIDLSKGYYRRWDKGLRLEANFVVKRRYLCALSYEAGLTSVTYSANNFRNNAFGISLGYLTRDK